MLEGMKKEKIPCAAWLGPKTIIGKMVQLGPGPMT